MKRITKLIIALTIFLTVGTWIGSKSQVAQAATGQQTEAIARNIRTELNNLREQNGLPDVSGVYVLTNMAQNRANYLSRINRLDGHAGYNYQGGAPYTSVAGENIGYWYNSSISNPKTIAKQIISQLYDDQGVADFGHRKNMLNPYFKHVGVGVSINPVNGYVYYAQDFGTTNAEMGNNFAAAKAYSEYSSQIGVSSQYPSQYDSNYQDVSTNVVASSIKKINSVVTTTKLTPLYDAPQGKITSRSLAKNTGWYTDQVYTDSNGNHWYHVSTSEWAMI